MLQGTCGCLGDRDSLPAGWIRNCSTTCGNSFLGPRLTQMAAFRATGYGGEAPAAPTRAEFTALKVQVRWATFPEDAGQLQILWTRPGMCGCLAARVWTRLA